MSHGERQQPVPAGVLQGGDLAVAAPVENDVLSADGSRRELVLDLMAPGCGVPGIRRERFGESFGVCHRFSPWGQNVYRPASRATRLAAISMLHGNIAGIPKLGLYTDQKESAVTGRRFRALRSVGLGGFDRVLDVGDGGELHVVELPVLALHFPHID